MLISYNELKKLGINQEIEDISKLFFQLGHEVEEVINLNIDKLIVGEVKTKIKHPEADKLNICTVDIGNETLQIICGASNVELGKKVIVAQEGAIINNVEIKKTKLRGELSCGMLCSLEELGFNKSLLSEEEYLGIYEMPEDSQVGSNPMEILGFNDAMLDIFLTANRGDCQSYRGLYNDLIALTNYNNNKTEDNYKIKTFSINPTIETTFDLSIDSAYSKYFSITEVQNIEVDKTKLNNKSFLLKQGIKSQNNITDISNIILLKTGIPTHIYDADKIKGRIKLHKISKEEKFIGLDEKEITLPKGTLVISDEEKIISLAGVMGSNLTKITKDTKNILIEVAHFEAQEILKSGKLKVGKTDASIRYEKNVDYTIMDQVMNLIIGEIQKLNTNSKISNTIFQGNLQKENKEISLNYQTLNDILGIKIPKEEVQKILTNLNFEIIKQNEFNLIVKAPNYRYDQEIENDLIEEVIRIYNIDKIKISDNIISAININKVISNKDDFFLKKIEKIMLEENLNQVITYSLVNDEQINEFQEIENKNITLMSPLSKEHKNYRKSLLPSLLSVTKENFSYQEKTINIFEIANTYSIENEEIVEKKFLSSLVAGDYQNYYLGNKRKYNFYDLKEKLNNLMNKLNLNYSLEKVTTIKELNPYASANILINKKKVGIIGEVVYDYFKKIPEAIYVFELNLTELMNILKDKKIKYKEIDLFPEITRDLTITVKKEIDYEKLNIIFDDVKYLKTINLVDLYSGEYLKKDEQAYTIKLVFKGNNKTLKSEEIDKEMNKIFTKCQELDYEIKGL